jgi:hypothetical protein
LRTPATAPACRLVDCGGQSRGKRCRVGPLGGDRFSRRPHAPAKQMGHRILAAFTANSANAVERLGDKTPHDLHNREPKALHPLQTCLPSSSSQKSCTKGHSRPPPWSRACTVDWGPLWCRDCSLVGGDHQREVLRSKVRRGALNFSPLPNSVAHRKRPCSALDPQ